MYKQRYIYILFVYRSLRVADPGFCVRGKKFSEGSGNRLRFPAGPGQSPGRRTGGGGDIEVFRPQL